MSLHQPSLLPAAFNHTGVLGDLMIKVMTKARELKQQRIMASKMTCDFKLGFLNNCSNF